MARLTHEEMDAIDRLYRTPKERAEEINAILQTASKELGMDHTLFDVTCFCIQWLAMLATGSLSDDTDLVRIARLSNIWLYHKHYNAPEEVYGKPDRETKLELISLDEEIKEITK